MNGCPVALCHLPYAPSVHKQSNARQWLILSHPKPHHRKPHIHRWPQPQELVSPCPQLPPPLQASSCPRTSAGTSGAAPPNILPSRSSVVPRTWWDPPSASTMRCKQLGEGGWEAQSSQSLKRASSASAEQTDVCSQTKYGFLCY